MKFREYVAKRLTEGLALQDVRRMIIRALGGNPDSNDATNAPLTQFVEPTELLDRLNSLTGLQKLIQNSPSAMDAIQNADQHNLTANQLAAILANSE